MNWDSPSDRAALIERAGLAEYNRRHAEYLRTNVIQTVNGYAIRPVTPVFTSS